MRRMLERIGLKVNLETLTLPELMQKVYIPLLDTPPEEQDWDISFFRYWDWCGHVGVSFLAMLLEDNYWITVYDTVYDEMWKDMATTVGSEAQEEKIRQMVEYIYDRAHLLFIYSPLTLYAVNKEVSLVPQKFQYMRLKETSVTDNHWSVREKIE